jgi:uncharacterized Fe-S cluster-containing radical SAM superfamily protein
MYDPLELSKKIEAMVTKKEKEIFHRKYYRFRPAKFYGGIASADCVGCNLRCIYCWSNDLAREGKIGKFYSPEEVASNLAKIAEKFGYEQVRITGNEPTLSIEHLLQVLELIPQKYTFILETNGILLGANEKYVKELKKFPNLHVRVSLKGSTPAEFSKLTGAKPEAFQLQLKGLEFCSKHEISSHPAILIDFVERKNLDLLKGKLREIDEKFAEELEFESLIPYPHVIERLKKQNLE